MDVTAVGPDMWIGKLGHFLILLAFFTALISAISYWKAYTIEENASESIKWRDLGRTAFFMHGLSLIVVVGLVFFLLASKKYVYAYAYQHASNDLPFRYLFAAFWEGQEGSTMLWAFWHVILGFIFIFTARKWKAPVLGTISLVQIFLMSMLLGVYIFETRIGVSPFVLLKSNAINAPVFEINPNFVPKDGIGLNELLRNYWMVIHPPIVFLGFASVTIPFGYALGALVKRDLQGWIKPATPWALWAAGLLGTGILMGGAWAYESLSFGGFWAWDPVENASLVPWLILVAGIHLMLIFRNTGYSGLAAFVLIILSFLFIIYSTFLTKSGVLGETSVHSFTDLGMSGQLVLFMIFFSWLSFTLLLKELKFRAVFTAITLLIVLQYFITKNFSITVIGLILAAFASVFFVNDFPKKENEEGLWTREFWMFIGALVLILSALHITGVTSIPVYNKLFGSDYSIPDQPHYNSVQVWVAIALGLFTAIVQYFSYGNTNMVETFKKLAMPFCIAIGLCLFLGWMYKFKTLPNILLLFSSIFAIVANANYIFSVLRGRISVSGSALGHIGFGLLLLGIVISQSKKQVVSYNDSGFVYDAEGDAEFNEENVLLYEDETKKMGDYYATLKDDEKGNLRDAVVVNFKKVDSTNRLLEDFTLRPAFKAIKGASPDESSLIADPSIRRLPHQDFFTHISLINLGTEIDTTTFERVDFKVNDTIPYDRMVFILKSMQPGTTRTDIELEENDIVISANMEVVTKDGQYEVQPVYLIRGNTAIPYPEEIKGEKITLRIEEIKPEEDSLVIGIRSAKPFKKYILLKAMIFPLINFVWLGSILMFVGFLVSMRSRLKANRA